MDVSVIIVNYNTFALTCKCVQSVLSKTEGCSLEVIVVDNASDEKDPYLFLEAFPEIKLVVSKRNVGFAAGNNLGIENATGEYVLLLNSDTELLNNAILYCLESMRLDHQIGAMGCRLIFPDGRPQHNCQRFPAVRYKAFELLRLQKILPGNVGARVLLGAFFNHDVPVYPDWIWGTFFFFRRSILNQLPGKRLADDFFMYAEDMQWCMDLRRLGYRIAFEPRAEVLHHTGKSGANKPKLMEENTRRFMQRHYSPVKMVMLKILDRWLQY